MSSPASNPSSSAPREPTYSVVVDDDYLREVISAEEPFIDLRLDEEHESLEPLIEEIRGASDGRERICEAAFERIMRDRERVSTDIRDDVNGTRFPSSPTCGPWLINDAVTGVIDLELDIIFNDPGFWRGLIPEPALEAPDG